MNLEKAYLAVTGLTVVEGIKKAIEGGWDNFHTFNRDEDVPEEFAVHFLLDTQSWKCLGEAMGWEMVDDFSGEKCIRQHGNCTNMDCNEEWKFKQHKFLDELQKDI